MRPIACDDREWPTSRCLRGVSIMCPWNTHAPPLLTQEAAPARVCTGWNAAHSLVALAGGGHRANAIFLECRGRIAAGWRSEWRMLEHAALRQPAEEA